MRRIGWIVSVFAMCVATAGVADVGEKLAAAIADPSRGDADVARDANRLPAKTLEFFGLQEDWRVMELVPGGGWYTKLLAPTLAEEGELFVALGTQGVEKMQSAGMFEGVEVLPVEGVEIVQTPGERRLGLSGELKLDVKKLDLVLTFRNMHNFNVDARKAVNDEVFRVLRKGGLYGVVDHTRRHMEQGSSENWRRIDPVLVIQEVQAAGFELVKFSDLHYRADDELRFEVGRRSVSGNTDRFTLLFRKP